MKKLFFLFILMPFSVLAQSLDAYRFIESNGYLNYQRSLAESPVTQTFGTFSKNLNVNGFVNFGVGKFLSPTKARSFGLSYILSKSDYLNQDFDSLNQNVQAESNTRYSSHSFHLYNATSWYKPLYKKIGYFYRLYTSAGFGLNSSYNYSLINNSEFKYNNPDRFNVQVTGSFFAGLQVRASELLLCTLGFRMIHVGLSYGQYSNSENGKEVINRSIRYDISSSLRPAVGLGNANIGIIWLFKN
ncbi:MAG: hypothetical protein L6Q78_08225 [Bacteroidia bacterium]|nr:hypothetical protein [Bacteroidia bacterium]